LRFAHLVRAELLEAFWLFLERFRQDVDGPTRLPVLHGDLFGPASQDTVKKIAHPYVNP